MDKDVYNVDDLVLQLKNQPSSSDIKDIVKSFGSISDKVSKLKLITTFMNYTIPEIYTELPKDVKNDVKQVFQTLIGLGNLLGKVVALKDMKESSVEPRLLKQYVSFLTELFELGLPLKLVEETNKLVDIKETEKLIFKGKAYSIVNEICTRYDIDDINPIFMSSEHFAEYLSKSILEILRTDRCSKNVNSFILSVLSFSTHSYIPFFDVLFTESTWPYFYKAFCNMKTFEKRRVLSELLVFISKRFLNKDVPDSKILAMSSILSFASDLIDSAFLENVISTGNDNLDVLIALILSHSKQPASTALVMNLLSKWGDDSLIKVEPISTQMHRTHLLLQLLAHQNTSDLSSKLLKDTVFLNAITNRLNSLSENIKTLGVIFGDKICEFGEQPKIFNFEEVDGYLNLINLKILKIKERGSFTPWKVLTEPIVVELEHETELVQAIKKLPIDDKSTTEVDSDDESDEDSEEPLTKGNKIAKPLYIKDLLEYISIDTSKPQAYKMRRMALTVGPTLLRQKSSFGNELSFYSEDLITNLIALTNFYDEMDFEELRLNCMIAVVVSNTASTFHLFELLLTGDYSLQQRMSILTTASLAARELKGFEDESVIKSYTRSDFPTKLLPIQQHLAFGGLDVNSGVVNVIHNRIQDSLMTEASEEAQNELSGGKILRISRKLKTPTNQVISVPKIHNFSKIIGIHFYFPLVNVWYQSGGIDIGHYSPILTAHFLKTLSLLLHAAYPSAVSLNDMMKEFIQIIIPLTKKISLDELQMIEAVVTGMLLIFDIIDEQYLITNYQAEIMVLQKWLTVSWEAIIDDKVKSLCAGLLLRITAILEKFERLLLDQINNFY